MEPQIIDYYNEEPQMMKIIEKMNDELSNLQKEYDILKDDLCLNEAYGRPKVEYDGEDLKKIKEESYIQLKKDIYKGILGEGLIKRVLGALVPQGSEAKIRCRTGSIYENARTTNWVHWKSCDILKHVTYSFNSLKKLNIETEKNK